MADGPAADRGDRVPGGGIRHFVAGGHVLPRCPGDRATARQQDAWHGPARLQRDPAAVEPDRVAVDVLPGARPRHAGGRAGGMGTVLPRQAGGDGDPLVVDGRPARAAAPGGLRPGLARGAALPAGGRRRTGAAVHHPGDPRHGDHADPGQRVSRAAHPRHPRPDHRARRRRDGVLRPARRSRAAGPPGGVPAPGRLHRRAADAVAPAAAERMGPGHDHELAEPCRRPAADRAAVDDRRCVHRHCGVAAPPLARPRVRAGAGGERAFRARDPVGRAGPRPPRRHAGDAARVHPQGPAGLLPRQHPVEPAHPPRRAGAGDAPERPDAPAVQRPTGCRPASSW